MTNTQPTATTNTELSPAAQRVLARLGEAASVCAHLIPIGPDVTDVQIAPVIQWIYDRIEQQEMLDAAKAEGGDDE